MASPMVQRLLLGFDDSIFGDWRSPKIVDLRPTSDSVVVRWSVVVPNGCGGGDRLDRGREHGQTLLLHCSGNSLLSGFSVMMDFSSSGSRSELVLSIKESLLEAAAWLAATWSDHIEGPKLVSCCCFLLLHSSGEPLFKAFPRCEEDPMKVVVW